MAATLGSRNWADSGKVLKMQTNARSVVSPSGGELMADLT